MLPKTVRSIAATLCLLVPICSEVQADNWPQWRGPTFNGASTEKNLPTQWSATENIAWAVPLPGPSGATPIIWGDKVFVSSADQEKNLLLVCLDRKSGKELWREIVAVGDRKTSQGNNMASPSPVTDGERVITTYGTGDVAAFDLNGKKLWSRNLGKEHGKIANMWLYGSSPLLFEGKLYIQVLQRTPVPPDYAHSIDGKEDRESYLLCVDPKTGKDLWRQVRPTDAIVESQEAYSTPFPLVTQGKTEIIVLGGDYVTAHDPKSGAELWRCGSLNSKKDKWWRIITSPVGHEGIVYAAAPKREPLIAVKSGGKGVVTDSHIVWRFTEFPPDVCTPLVYQGKLFVLDGDKQTMTCLDPKTGEKKWQGNLGVRETFRSSPTGADGKIYAISDRGTVVVLSAGDQFEVISTVKMGEKHDHASIAVAQGNLFIRTDANLYCVGKKW